MTLPEGWTFQKLGELCTFQRGLTYGKSDEVESSANVVLRANNVDLESHELDLSELKYISDDVVIPPTKKVQPGALLLCMASGSKSHLGKVAFIDEDYGFAFGGFMGQVSPRRTVDGRYIFYALTSGRYRSFIADLSDGVNINNLKFDDLGQFPVPVPPLPEQRRIVAILDEAFEAIATAKANTEKNLANAREVVESYHQSLFAQVGETAQATRLGDIATFRNGVNYTKSSKGQTVKIVGVKDFQSNFLVPTDSLEDVTLDGPLNPVDAVSEGDILTVRSNGNPELIGRCMLVEDLLAATAHSGFTIRISVDRSKVFPAYACHFLRSRNVRRKLIEGGNGVNIKSLNQGMLAEVSLPLPSLRTQREVVQELASVSDAAASLYEITQRKSVALNELKQAVLHQAFAGAL